MVKTEPKSPTSSRKKRKKKYIPGLAAFKFRPVPDWKPNEARRFYEQREEPVHGFGINRIEYSDCIEGMKRLPESCIDLVVADPPFGLEFSGKSHVYNRDESLVIDGYREVDEEYRDFTHDWISELPRIMKDDATAYIFSGWNNLEHLEVVVRESGLHLLNHVVWRYQFGVFTMTKFVTSHYHLLVVVKDPDEYYFHKIEHYPLDVWDIPRKYRTGQKKNGTVLPEAVVRRCIDFSSEPGDLILDPFMGNGTTAIVAKANFRHFIGFEINRNLEPIISENLLATSVGERYTSYASRLPSPEELKEKYPRAYKIFMKRLRGTEYATKR